MSADAALISLHHAGMSFGRRVLWQDVCFEILPGQFTVLLGANGCGKTTLFRTLLGLEKLKGGAIQRAPHLQLGYVAQMNLFEPRLPMRGRDLVRLGLDGDAYALGWFSRKRRQAASLVERAIREVGAQDFADAPLELLSGGERQRLRIAQALVGDPPLLLLDEPLASLDPGSQQIVCAILNHRKTTHRTAIFMITHELHPVLPLADKVLSLQNGRAIHSDARDFLHGDDLNALYHTLQGDCA